MDEWIDGVLGIPPAREEWFDELLERFNSDLPTGYKVRCEADPELGLVLALWSHGTEWWREGIAVQGVLDRRLVGAKLRTLQGELIEHEFGHAWPRCPVHGSHPLRAEGDGWHCPIVDSTSASSLPPHPDTEWWDYGSLARFPAPPEPHREDGMVRWYLDDLGWGVIAHHEGDLFVHFSAIAGDGYRRLEEGERVAFNVDPGRQGKFRRAVHVRRAPR